LKEGKIIEKYSLFCVVAVVGMKDTISVCDKSVNFESRMYA
jgi:hypothetical protein